MYLQQSCSHVSVNKTILKPRVAAATGAQYLQVGFRDVIKFRVAAHTISVKAMRFRHPDYNPDRALKLISSSMSRHLSTLSRSPPTARCRPARRRSLQGRSGATVDEHGLRFYGFLSETMECGVRAAASIYFMPLSESKSTRTVVSNAVGVCAMSMMRQLV